MNEEEIERKLGERDRIIDQLTADIEDMRTDHTAISQEIESIKEKATFNSGQIEKLKISVRTNDNKIELLNTLPSRVSTLENKMYHKVDVSSLASKANVSDLASKANVSDLASKANVSDLAKISREIKYAQSKQMFKTCMVLCAILILNIVATWLIIYRPGYSNLSDKSLLPWSYTLILFAIMLANIVSTVIWIKICFDDNNNSAAFEAIVEVILLVFSTVAMWLFAFNPLKEVINEAIALAVFLMLTNLLEIIMRIIYFSYCDRTMYGDISTETKWINIIEVGLLCVVLLIYIFVGVRLNTISQ